MTEAEFMYWRDRAAALDPAAYLLFKDLDNWIVTVPADETWYTADLWWVKINDCNSFIREANAERMLMLPGGTTLSDVSGRHSSAYICQPTLVAADARYSDPKALYYDRLARLRTLPLRSISAHMLPDKNSGSHANADFPADFERGLITAVATMDVSWTVRFHSPGGSNTFNEISDDHALRSAAATFIPFNRSVFPAIQVRSGSRLGLIGDKSIEGWGTVHYYALPSDW